MVERSILLRTAFQVLGKFSILATYHINPIILLAS